MDYYVFFCYLPIALLILIVIIAVISRFLRGHIEDKKSKLGAKLRKIIGSPEWKFFSKIAGNCAAVFADVIALAIIIQPKD